MSESHDETLAPGKASFPNLQVESSGIRTGAGLILYGIISVWAVLVAFASIATFGWGIMAFVHLRGGMPAIATLIGFASLVGYLSTLRARPVLRRAIIRWTAWGALLALSMGFGMVIKMYAEPHWQAWSPGVLFFLPATICVAGAWTALLQQVERTKLGRAFLNVFAIPGLLLSLGFVIGLLKFKP